MLSDGRIGVIWWQRIAPAPSELPVLNWNFVLRAVGSGYFDVVGVPNRREQMGSGSLFVSAVKLFGRVPTNERAKQRKQERLWLSLRLPSPT